MPSKDIHKEPFSEETITKLDIFENYLKEWLPVAIQSHYIDSVYICDFFAGSGKDKKGSEGSPLRIMRVINKFTDSILKKNLSINIFFNEKNKSKYKELNNYIEVAKNSLNHLSNNLNVTLFNEDFKQLFDAKKALLKNNFNLLFLDQSGIKQITQEVFLDLTHFSKTDFMFFISSSFFKRFATDISFNKYFPDIDHHEVIRSKQTEIHRIIYQYYKNKLPQNSLTKLYPFTIKKGRNIYGLIFGTNHPLGVDKFLKIAWETNALNGEANFDINEDWQTSQEVLFGKKMMSKKEKFQVDLEHHILSMDTISNKEIYDFTLENGHIINNALPVLKKMQKDNKISYSGHHNISYNKCYKEKELKYFKVINK